MRRLFLFLGAVFFGVCMMHPVTARASAITPELNEAETQFNKGNVLGAASALRQALVTVYNHSVLKVEKAILVKSKPVGFGMIEPRNSNKFKANETIIIYVEPVGYHFARQGDVYKFGVTADFSVTDDKGNILGGKKRFGSWEITTRHRPLFDFFMTLTYNFTGIRPGKYFLLTTLNDRHGGGSTTIKMPFEIVK